MKHQPVVIMLAACMIAISLIGCSGSVTNSENVSSAATTEEVDSSDAAVAESDTSNNPNVSTDESGSNSDTKNITAPTESSTQEDPVPEAIPNNDPATRITNSTDYDFNKISTADDGTPDSIVMWQIEGDDTMLNAIFHDIVGIDITKVSGYTEIQSYTYRAQYYAWDDTGIGDGYARTWTIIVGSHNRHDYKYDGSITYSADFISAMENALTEAGFTNSNTESGNWENNSRNDLVISVKGLLSGSEDFMIYAEAID